MFNEIYQDNNPLPRSNSGELTEWQREMNRKSFSGKLVAAMTITSLVMLSRNRSEDNTTVSPCGRSMSVAQMDQALHLANYPGQLTRRSVFDRIRAFQAANCPGLTENQVKTNNVTGVNLPNNNFPR